MQVTEQNKKEAEKVVEKYSKELYHELTLIKQVTATTLLATYCAIINRQSVLDMLDYLSRNNIDNFIVDKEITNLTEQIEYLKYKL